MGRHNTIAGRKEKQDAKRAQIFTKYARAITVAAKGGGDMEYNMALKNAVEKAKAINMPNDNITRAIKKGTGELGGDSYESGTFEGYGPGGVAIIVETLTDNKNRTTAAVKHNFDKYGGNLGVPGCVGYMFNRKGYILIEKTDDIDEDELMMVGMDAGMEDMTVNEDSFEIFTEPNDFAEVADALRNAGYELLESDIDMVPTMTSEPPENVINNLKKLVAALEDDDDVQKVYTNCDVDLED
ncbi:MAG: YebC/PmpR family DNA-binding transcriptional regulator [Firmicutes bacterium]|nr:YebC/PmpR family DNA-binding transcriptional regulator [Bacillota bacterium]MBR2576584.1 YebC/PmpR family DNA-binding transcriptional regulator [Bacillota bacterium]